MHFNFKDITGNKYGKLTVENFEGMGKNGQSLWECKCECGIIKTIQKNSLISGKTKSCGCLKKNGTHKTHGMKGTRLYRCWQAMKTRCGNPKAKGYENYGGRGIKICDEWENSFEEFAKWAMANQYTKYKTLDRIDNNGDYQPSNCRWATKKEQANNQRSNRFLAINGVTMNLQQWADKTGVPRSTIQWRADHGITGVYLIKPTKKIS